MTTLRATLACLVLPLLLAAGQESSARAPASVEEIAALIRDLGSERYDRREEATEALKRIGLPARDALEKAAESDDPEVRVRARKVLTDVRLGITPDWPADLALMARHYDRLTQRSERLNTIRRIADALKEKAVPFLVVRMASADAAEANGAFEALKKVATDDVWQVVVDLVDKPKTVQQSRALALAYSRLGRTLDALKLLSTGNIDEGTRRRMVDEAVKRLLTLRSDRKFKELAESAGALVEVVENEARFLYLWADALEALEEDEQAVTLREKALALNAAAEAPHFTVGEMLMGLGSYRLAEKEWLAILKMPPEGGVYDINAHMRLGTVYEKSHLYARAADAIEKGLAGYVAAREAGHGMGMAGGSEEQVRGQIEKLREKAKGRPARPEAQVKDRIPANWMHFHISVRFKDNKAKEYQRELAATVGRLDVKVEPAGVKIFDVVPTTLKYDPEKKEIVVLMNGSPCGAPSHFEGKGETFRVMVRSLDCCYVFEIDAATGEAKRLSRFEKDYRLRVEPGIKFAALTDVTFKLNDTEHNWEDLLKGKEFDYLPKELNISVTGTTPKGKRFARTVKAPFKEPRVPPLKETPPDPPKD